MKALLILLNIALTQANIVLDKDEYECAEVQIDGVFQDEEVLKRDIDRPYNLAVDYSSNTVYFSYSVNANDDAFRTASFNLNTKEFVNFEGITNGFAQAVDQETHDLYIGGSDGIYKYDYLTKKTELVTEQGTDIWIMFFKDGVLYYAAYPAQFLYTYANGEKSKFKDLEDTKVDQFVIDNKDFVFFTNSTGLYSQKKGSKDATLYKQFTGTSARALAVDYNGDVFALMGDGIYKVNKDAKSLDKFLSVEDPFGLAFDNKNKVIYSEETKLVRLIPNKEKNC